MENEKILVLGGVRSGKSALAEKLVMEVKHPVVYVATATAGDDEMAVRIHHHRERRPSAWRLAEVPLRLGETLLEHGAEPRPPCLLIDCMSLWLSYLLHVGNEIFERERNQFLEALEGYPGPAVIVSNEVGLGIIGMDPLTRRFADELGWLNQNLATHCERVMLSVAGLSLTLKEDKPGQDTNG